MKSIAKYRQVFSTLFCLTTGNKFFLFNRPTYKQGAELRVCDAAIDQEITFIVAKLLRPELIVRARVDKRFVIRDLS